MLFHTMLNGLWNSVSQDVVEDKKSARFTKVLNNYMHIKNIRVIIVYANKGSIGKEITS